MATIFILPKDQECKEKHVSKDILSNPYIKIIIPSGLLYNGPNGLDKVKSANNILAKMNSIQAEGERYLLYHIGNLVDISAELHKADSKLIVRLYSGAGIEEEHNNILSLIERVRDNTETLSIEELIGKYFYDKELEAKLDLLHKCLAFATTPRLDNLLTDKHERHYKDFLAAVKDKVTDGTGEGHINALTELRRALLGS